MFKNPYLSGVSFNEIPALTLEKISFFYKKTAIPNEIFSDVSFSVLTGQTCAITGPSGAGKSTLMSLMGLLERPASGKIFIEGEDVSSAGNDERSRLRNMHLGFVFQGFNLFPRLTALENVAVPLMYRGLNRREASRIAAVQLKNVGLGEYHNHRPNEMSGGQCQRVAIARALSGSPAIVLADEPTGNLDDVNGNIVIELLLEMNERLDTTLIVVTHDESIAGRMKRRFVVDARKVAER
ncbi:MULTISPECIES: ABC transporter ATP-binding protein [Gammaproteobacteria]|uniref:ABC transporter ATP-binding protein n=1 Tax=Pantoea sp. BJFS-204 TaxID=3404823 RepID=UPI003BB4A1FC